MKQLLMLMCWGLAPVLYGQITITRSHLPNSGDTFRFSNARSLTINTTTTGANTNWDYTGLVSSSQGLDEYKSFLRTPYLFYSQFFGAIGLKTADTLNFGPLRITNVHTFYRKRSSSYTAEGTGFTTAGVPLASDYSNSDRVYKLPMQYNQQDSDQFRVATSVPGIGTFIQQGTRKNHVDGWGKISTPYRDDMPCLRIKSDVLEVDSLKTTFVSLGFPVNRREIKWLGTQERQPIMEITGPLVAGIFTPAVVKYRDSFRSSNPPTIGPRVSFSVNRRTGVKDVDTFDFRNTTVPAQGLSYSWSFTPNQVRYVKGTSGNQPDVSVVFTDTGKYDVRLRATSVIGTFDTLSRELITISNPANSVKDADLPQLLLLPNPANSYISFTTPRPGIPLQVDVLDMHGRKVKSAQITVQGKLDIRELKSGRYLVVVSQKDQQIQLLFDKY